MKRCFAVLFVFSALFFSGCNELRKSEEKIKSEILSRVPLGSDISAVLDFLKTSNCEIRSVNRNGGFYDQRVTPAKETGTMSVRANLGDYRGIICRVNVTVYFAFDKDGRLIDIWVWKITDAP